MITKKKKTSQIQKICKGFISFIFAISVKFLKNPKWLSDFWGKIFVVMKLWLLTFYVLSCFCVFPSKKKQN